MSTMLPAGKRRTRPGMSPSPGVLPSSLTSNSICRPMQMPRNGFVRAASSTAARRPRPSISRTQSGIAPWPGKTTRSARFTTSASLVIVTSSPAPTCSIALATECRLPMP